MSGRHGARQRVACAPHRHHGLPARPGELRPRKVRWFADNGVPRRRESPKPPSPLNSDTVTDSLIHERTGCICSKLHWMFAAAKNLCSQNVLESQGVRPMFQRSPVETTFASSSPLTPGMQSVSVGDHRCSAKSLSDVSAAGRTVGRAPLPPIKSRKDGSVLRIAPKTPR